jgi:hypothetical protein
MEIEITAPKEILEEFRFHLHDQLLAAGFTQGPKIDSVESGIIIEYLKGNQIVSLEIQSELEGKNSIMHVEANQEIPELKELWDQAVLSYGKVNMERLLEFALDKNKVRKELKGI